MMEKLVKYDSDDDASRSQNNMNEEVSNATTTTLANLESEWESFEKMIAGGAEEAATEPQPEAVSEPQPEAVSEPQPEAVSELQPEAVSATTTASAPAATENTTTSSSSVYNPYAYLSQYAKAPSPTDKDGNVLDMEKQLEEFLERTAQAASNEACTTDQNAENEEAFTGSESEEHSGSESDHSSHHSHHSNSPSDEKQPTDKPHTDNLLPAAEKHDEASGKTPDLEKDSSSASRSSHRRPHSPHRSRSHRSKSRSKRSRSRSRHRHKRRRSSSRSRHGGSRRRRRSGSRPRRRGRRSRSPRHRHDKHRSSRHRRSRRRSGSRGRDRDINRTTRRAMYGNPPQAKPPVQEDFKAKMKRELQQAAKDAMAGKGQATPQQALLQTMAAMHAKAQELTGVEIPKFYNPAAINPLKFAEQQQKRKLLWSKAGQNKEQSLQKFQGTEVVADEKYRKLMGIKGEVEVGEQSDEQKQKQSELFAKLDQEYAMARLTTHTHRGMGLGIVSSIAAASANEQMNRP